jgi:hypothetical protein
MKSMNMPEYISKEEVQRVCQELGLSDWTGLTGGPISLEEAKIIQDVVGSEASRIPTADFKLGLEVELEHGTQFPDANVTNNHPILTGRIVLAHLKEMLDYYQRLEVAELEGDMRKAFQTEDRDKLYKKYRLLLQARAELYGKENPAED